MKRMCGIAVLVLAPTLSWGCACGCGVFDVQTSALFPADAGGVAFLEFNHMDQNKNWSGASRAPGADNADKDIRTESCTAGIQYMFSHQWGLLVEVPYLNRSFQTTAADGQLVRFDHSAWGDVRIKGLYAGFSPDMSSGLTLGLKLPTGDYTYPHFDRDTEIGTGSTDVLLGGYLMGQLPLSASWDWFLTAQMDQPALTRDAYHPGSELDAVAGLYYTGWRVPPCKLTPVLQAIGSHHWRDQGAAADSDNTGYDRVLLAPGLELDIGKLSLYAEVALPAYQNVNGNQLVAPALFTLRISCSF